MGTNPDFTSAGQEFFVSYIFIVEPERMRLIEEAQERLRVSGMPTTRLARRDVCARVAIEFDAMHSSLSASPIWAKTRPESLKF